MTCSLKCPNVVRQTLNASRPFEGLRIESELKDWNQLARRSKRLSIYLPTTTPQKMPRKKETNLGLLGQFVTTALNIVCRNANIAPSLVGTAQDVRNLAAWKLGLVKLKQPPELAAGWRAEIVGQVIEQILDGKLVIRVDDPRSEHPLIIEKPSSP